MRVGFISHRQNPLETLPEPRARALLAEAALQGVTFSIISKSDYDMEAGRLLTFDWQDDAWVASMQPIPDLLFQNRGALDEVQERFLAWLAENTIVIADKGVDKVELEAAMHGSACERYLIPTQTIPQENTLDVLIAFFRDHGSSVIKRSTGNRGVGLFFAMARDGLWQVTHDRKTFTGPLEEAAAYVAQRIGGRLRYRDYIAQKFIPAATADGRAVDVRVHVQRRASGDWGVTRAYVRLSEAGALLANTSRGF